MSTTRTPPEAEKGKTLRDVLERDLKAKTVTRRYPTPHGSEISGQQSAKQTLNRIAAQTNQLKQSQYAKASMELLQAELADQKAENEQKKVADYIAALDNHISVLEAASVTDYEEDGDGAKDELKKLLAECYEKIETVELKLDTDDKKNQWWENAEKLCKAKVGDTEAESSILNSPVAFFSQHPTKLELSKHLSRNMGDWMYVKKKEVGRNSAGVFGGEYICCYEVEGEGVKTQRALIKQDTYLGKLGYKLIAVKLARLLKSKKRFGKIRHDKNIAEYAISRYLNEEIGNLAATVLLGKSPWDSKTEKPRPLPIPQRDETGENTYDISIFFDDDCRSLLADLYIEEGLPVPKSRPRVNNPFYSSFTKIYEYHLTSLFGDKTRCRYNGFDATRIGSLKISDFDAHVENDIVEVVYETDPKTHLRNLDEKGNPIPKYLRDKDGKQIFLKKSNGELLLDGDGQPIPAKEKVLKRIDFGGGLHALYGEIGDDVHMHSILRHLFPFVPTNHIRETPRCLRVNEHFAEQLMLQGYSPEQIERMRRANLINEFINEIAEECGIEPFKYFTKRMGLEIPHINDLDLAASIAKNFLITKLAARELSLAKTEVEIRLSTYTKVMKKEVVKDPRLTKLIYDHPNYMKKGIYHFRGKEQLNQRFYDAVTYYRREWTGRRIYRNSRIYDYAESILAKKDGDDKDMPGILRADFEVQDIALRAEVYIARLRMIAAYCDKAEDKEKLANIVTDLLLWQSNYRKSKTLISSSETACGNVYHLCDVAFREFRRVYVDKLSAEKKIDVDFNLKINQYFDLTKKSEQERYAKSFTLSADAGKIILAPRKEDSVSKPKHTSKQAQTSPYYHTGRLFSPPMYDYQNVDGMTLATATAISGIVTMVNEIILALAALNQQYEALYGRPLTPPTTPAPTN